MRKTTLHLGDCIEVMRGLADNSVDAIVTDPPYHLTNGKQGGSGPASLNEASPAGRARISTGFMGKAWDGGGIAQSVEMWTEALRVLKPGGHLLAFGGSRTYHRMASAIEDAGFDIRDQIMWIYGSGFPKSHNGEWGGTALKPAHEPICMARKPLIGTVAANWATHGTGALNIDASRIAVADADYARNCSGDRGHDQNRTREMEFGMTAGSADPLGRWPANVIHDGSAEVLAGFPAQAGARAPVHLRNGDKFRNAFGAFAGNIDEAGSTFQGDSGSAARFFYCAKASRTDRNEGCEGMQQLPGPESGGGRSLEAGKQGGYGAARENHHPTVKPSVLMQYLVRLVTPPGGVVLDPFMGSGSTGKACVREGFGFVGIELGADYLAIAEARIAHAQAQMDKPAPAPSPQIELFAAEA